MSQERRRAREARQAARRAEVEAAARRRHKQARRRAVARTLAPSLPRRRRRYGALPARVRYELVVVFLVVQVLAWWLLASYGARFSVAVLTAAVLLVLVRTRRSPAR